MHANECLNKKQQPIIYSVDSAPKKEDKDYEIEEDKDGHGDVNTSSSRASQYSKGGKPYSCS